MVEGDRTYGCDPPPPCLDTVSLWICLVLKAWLALVVLSGSGQDEGMKIYADGWVETIGVYPSSAYWLDGFPPVRTSRSG